MSSLKESSTASATIVYLLLSFLPAGIRFLLLPIYVNYLTPEDYGILSLLLVFGSFYAVFSILQLDTAARVEYFKVADQREFEKKLFSSSLVLGALILIPFGIVGPFVFDQFFTDIKVEFYPAGWIVILINFMSALINLFFVFLRNKFHLKELSFYTVLVVLISTVFQFYFIVIEGTGYIGSLYGSLIANGTILLTVVIRNYHLIPFRWDKKFIKNSLSLSLPLILNLVLVWIQQSTDRIYLERFLSIDKVGLYSILMTILGAAFLFNKAYGMAIRPTLFKYLNDVESNSNNIKRVVNRFIILSIASVSGVLLIGLNLSLITDKSRYLEIVPYFTWGVLILIPKMLIKIPRLQLLFHRRTGMITVYTAVSAILIIVLIPVFIRFDFQGVIIAISIAHLIEFILYYRSFRKAAIPHNTKFALVSLIISIFLVVTSFHISQYLQFSEQTFGFIQFILVSIALIIIGKKEIQSILRI